MAFPDTDDQNTPAAKPVRPSWESAPPRPAVPPRPAAPLRRPAAPPYRAAAPTSVVESEFQPTPEQAADAPAPAYHASFSYETPLDSTVRYDLAGNPLPDSAPPPAAPPAPFGYSAGNAAAGVWPPPVSSGGPGYGGGAQIYSNNSGSQSHVPPEIERLKWHWGAFFFPILWTRKHGLTTVASMLTGGLMVLRLLRYVAAAMDPLIFMGICALYSVAFFGLQIYGGLNGHRIGWRNRHFPGGLEEYFKVQTAWMWWGFGVNVFLGPVLLFLFLVVIVGTSLLTPHPTYHSYGNGYGNSGSYGSGNSAGYGNSSGYGSGSSDGNGSSSGGSGQ